MKTTVLLCLRILTAKKDGQIQFHSNDSNKWSLYNELLLGS